VGPALLVLALSLGVIVLMQRVRRRRVGISR
jgi:hypothetical protein